MAGAGMTGEKEIKRFQNKMAGMEAREVGRARKAVRDAALRAAPLMSENIRRYKEKRKTA